MNSVFEKLLKHTSFIIPKSPMCGFASQFLVADSTEKKNHHINIRIMWVLYPLQVA